MTEQVKCTLCAAVESPGFYTGCMVKDGHAPEWDCDGKGNLTRKPNMHTGPIQSEHFDGTLNGYQKAAQTTAIYPGKGTIMGLVYATLKGCGEAGEFSEKV